MKTKISLRLNRLSANDKLELARAMVSAMTGNPNFSSPTPSLAVVSAAATDLENAIIAAQDGGKSKTALMHAKENVLADVLSLLGLYVEATANGDSSILLSSGANAKHTAGAPQIPDTPQHVNGKASLTEGVILLNWDKIKNARVYVIEQLDDVSTISSKATSVTPVVAGWHQVAIVTKASLLVRGLSSGNKYAFRIYGVGAAGAGNYSTPIVVKAL